MTGDVLLQKSTIISPLIAISLWNAHKTGTVVDGLTFTFIFNLHVDSQLLCALTLNYLVVVFWVTCGVCDELFIVTHML